MQIHPYLPHSSSMAALEQAAAATAQATDALHTAIQAQSRAAALELQVDQLADLYAALRASAAWLVVLAVAANVVAVVVLAIVVS